MLVGTATAPRWIAQLDYAAVCGKEPKEIFGGSRALWWYRWKARRDIGIEVQKHFDRLSDQRKRRYGK